MELAIKQSLGASAEQPIDVDEQESAQEKPKPLQEQPTEFPISEPDLFSTIQAVPHEEPPNKPGVTTRIQVRTGDGGRMVRRFNVEDPVRTIYEVIKAQMEGFDHEKFTLGSHQREDLIGKLDMTIQDAGLKNSSLLLEKVEDEE